MKRVLFSALLACFAFLPGAGTLASAASASTAAVVGHPDEGRAAGTVVVWDNFTSGKPTAHLRGTLRDKHGKWFADVVTRLEDNGCVTGYARTKYGYYDLRGWWDFDRYRECGEFELAFDYGDSREVELQGSFKGRHSYWNGEWELDYRD